MSDVFSWLIVSGAAIGPLLGFLAFLRFFQVTRSQYRETVLCPEKEEKATVVVAAGQGASGPYRDVRSCTLLGEKPADCGKGCLTPNEVLQEPFKSQDS
jgi:hypothetical protein